MNVIHDFPYFLVKLEASPSVTASRVQCKTDFLSFIRQWRACTSSIASFSFMLRLRIIGRLHDKNDSFQPSTKDLQVLIDNAWKKNHRSPRNTLSLSTDIFERYACVYFVLTSRRRQRGGKWTETQASPTSTNGTCDVFLFFPGRSPTICISPQRLRVGFERVRLASRLRGSVRSQLADSWEPRGQAHTPFARAFVNTVQQRRSRAWSQLIFSSDKIDRSIE